MVWNIISKYVKYFVSVDDSYAAVGMRILGNPLGDDLKKFHKKDLTFANAC